MARPVHENIIRNHRHRFKVEQGSEYPGTDQSIIDFVNEVEFTGDSNAEEDDWVQALMQQQDKESGI